MDPLGVEREKVRVKVILYVQGQVIKRGAHAPPNPNPKWRMRPQRTPVKTRLEDRNERQVFKLCRPLGILDGRVLSTDETPS